MDMRRVLHASMLASSVALGAAACLTVTTPVWAQMDQSGDADSGVSFDSFQNQLAPYGYWLYSDRWGVVWQPAQVSDDFRPYYTAGRWAYTDDYGWLWQSDFAWGDIPFHYGRWVNDPDDGWLWMPGYVWSPGWVAWRSNGQYIGWMPMPPDDAFLQGGGDISIGTPFRFGVGDSGGLYGYSQWYGPEYDENRFAQNWVFVGVGQIGFQDYRTVAIADPAQIVNIIHQTRNVTNYTVVNNYVVNKSIDVHVVERAAGHPIPVVRAAAVIHHPNLLTTVDVGQRAQLRMRAVAPHGTGVANSAPPPPPHVVAALSTHVTAHHGGAPSHLFTKTTAAAPEAQSRFHGPAVHAPAGGAPGAGAAGAMGPGAERPHEQAPTGGPGAMTGPSGERPHPETQPHAAGEMTGPSAERPHHETPPGAPAGAMGATGEHTQAPSAGASRMTQPPASSHPAAPVIHHPVPPAPNGAPPSTPPKKKEHPPNPPQ
jgi:hypothetical protein